MALTIAAVWVLMQDTHVRARTYEVLLEHRNKNILCFAWRYWSHLVVYLRRCFDTEELFYDAAQDFDDLQRGCNGTCAR
jgi:hypothetical protein